METLTHSKLLAVEGQDEVNFFTAFFRTLGINDVQILDFGGKNNFDNRITALPNLPGFDRVIKIGFIRDADDNPARSAYDSVADSIRKNGLVAPDTLEGFTASIPAVGIFIMPNNLGTGMLEDLCLDYVYDLPVSKCIDSFFDCLDVWPNQLPKAMIQIYLASKEPLVNSLGLGALKNHFDFASTHFERIRNFLLQFQS